MNTHRRPLKERFEEKVMPIPWSGCWIWTGGFNKKDGTYGYGRIGEGGWHGKNLLAHRVSYELHVGPIPSGMNVLHKCDTPACVNPAHLFTGTQVDNVIDCRSKGRLRRSHGIEHPHAKFSWEQVQAIRLDKRTLMAISQDYGISIGQASNIKRGKQRVSA